MKYIFLSVNEDLNCGLLKSQFIDPIKNNFKYDFEIISINKPFYSQRVQNVKRMNLLIPQKLIAYNFLCYLYTMWAILCAILVRINFIKSKRSTLVARGYLSGLISYYAKKYFGINYIFDPRSLYPLECITANRMMKNSICYKYWIKIERKIVNSAERIVCVSSGMSNYYTQTYGIDNVITVPCYRTDKTCGFDKTKDRAFLKTKLGLDHDKKVILYYGSLNNGWNNLDLYTYFISEKFSDDIQFLIITQDKNTVSKSKLGSFHNVFIYSLDTLPTRVSIDDAFHCSDYGMIFMSESHDWFTRLSVKFAEYTYFGLPVITNQWVGEAVKLIEDYKIYPSRIITEQKIELISPTQEDKNNICQWAREYFSPNNINKYVGR
ncbi:glycosyltransferase family 4 protein [Providencia rettgeri]|uniref:glycosyltransferase family 4 protein n=1 Tax=Providencia rettgeri TaxID=587 RepID=UPI00141A19A7|nr:glycosyltransferase family 4 protein [Providencia rettgeri]NIH03332.1 glycosyltransferase family 4 protein [Providencia rettgeri]